MTRAAPMPHHVCPKHSLSSPSRVWPPRSSTSAFPSIQAPRIAAPPALPCNSFATPAKISWRFSYAPSRLRCRAVNVFHCARRSVVITVLLPFLVFHELPPGHNPPPPPSLLGRQLPVNKHQRGSATHRKNWVIHNSHAISSGQLSTRVAAPRMFAC